MHYPEKIESCFRVSSIFEIEQHLSQHNTVLVRKNSIPSKSHLKKALWDAGPWRRGEFKVNDDILASWLRRILKSVGALHVSPWKSVGDSLWGTQYLFSIGEKTATALFFIISRPAKLHNFSQCLVRVGRVVDTLGKLLSIRGTINSCDSYTFLVLSNLPRASLTRAAHANLEPILNKSSALIKHEDNAEVYLLTTSNEHLPGFQVSCTAGRTAKCLLGCLCRQRCHQTHPLHDSSKTCHPRSSSILKVHENEPIILHKDLERDKTAQMMQFHIGEAKVTNKHEMNHQKKPIKQFSRRQS